MDDYNFVNNRIGYTYSFPIRMGGFAIAVIGLAITLTGGWGILAGGVLILAGLYFATTMTGIHVNLKDKAIQHYTSYYGLRYGRWKEYPTYSHICIIRKDMRRKRFYEQSESEVESPYQYQIHLVSRSFRGKALLEIAYDRESAEFRAKRYAEDMTASVTEYIPPGRAKKRGEHKHSGYNVKHNHGRDDE